jgi:hypothetical protein
MSSNPPILNTDPNANNPIAPRYIRCDMCKCDLTPTGQVYNVSDEARDFRDSKEKHLKQIETLTAERDSYKAQYEITNRELQALKNPAPPAVPEREKSYFEL